MLGEELGNLGFHSLGQKGARPATQDFGELVGEHPWLNELDDGIFGHGVSSCGGEVAGLITATIRRLHSFTPSPTSAHSSCGWRAAGLLITTTVDRSSTHQLRDINALSLELLAAYAPCIV